MRALALLLISFLLINSSVLSEELDDIVLDEINDLATNPGNLVMYAYKPATAKPGAPLIVLLHGCMQDAKSFALKTGWLARAKELGLILLMPEQRKLNNAVNCFTWYEEGDVVRDKGEVGSIANMIDYMEEKYDIDSSRIFTTGISAGGTMAAALAASYPERIKGAALVAAVSYGCTFNLLNSYGCMFSPTTLDPEEGGDRIRNAHGMQVSDYPHIFIVHGTSDSVVKFKNSTNALTQWLNVHGIDDEIDQIIPLLGYEIQTYENQNTTQVERLILSSVVHGWPINSAQGCGSNGQFYIDGPLCLTDVMLERWELK